MTYPIPTEALDDRLAIVGTAGSGKTYLALGAIEKPAPGMVDLSAWAKEVLS